MDLQRLTWLKPNGVNTAALLSVWDIVEGYAAKAGLHRELKMRFIALEIAILAGASDDAIWQQHEIERLRIEQDEPPIFRAFDTLCHNEPCLSGYHRHLLYVVGWLRIGDLPESSAARAVAVIQAGMASDNWLSRHTTSSGCL